MCRRVDCSKCGRPTFAGCGKHVERVLGDVPLSQRCACNGAKSPGPGAGQDSKARPGWLGSILRGLK